MIRPQLRDKINDYKTQGERKVHLNNTVIDYKTHGEWKTQLSMKLSFISLKTSD